jgi:hypothetical protein
MQVVHVPSIRDLPKADSAAPGGEGTPRGWALPTLDSVRTLLPASESLPDFGAYIPTYAGAKEHAAAVAAYLSLDAGLSNLSAYMPTSAGAKEHLAAARAYVPTLDVLKTALPTCALSTLFMTPCISIQGHGLRLLCRVCSSCAVC